MKSITAVFVTSRREPHLEWFLDSLKLQADDVPVIVVDSNCAAPQPLSSTLFWTPPKPTIWQGRHRITREDWWAKSNALNTGICLCQTDWIAFCDDRCVLQPGWFACIVEAMKGGYAVCGTYEKHAGVKVKDGMFVESSSLLGGDSRRQAGRPARTQSWYGGSGAAPLNWCLKVNGFAEDFCDSLGMEDSVFGWNLTNNRFPVCYDSRMKIVEDRTPGQIDGALKRADFGLSPNDKSHAIVARLRRQKTSLNSFDLRRLRASALGGNALPPPTAAPRDWYDGADIPAKFNLL